MLLWICGFVSFLLGLFINECVIKPRRETRLRIEEEEEEDAAEEEEQAMTATMATTMGDDTSRIGNGVYVNGIYDSLKDFGCETFQKQC